MGEGALCQREHYLIYLQRATVDSLSAYGSGPSQTSMDIILLLETSILWTGGVEARHAFSDSAEGSA
jgi:hypothetical protein